MITYVPNLNNIPIEDNYADTSQEEIKDTHSLNMVNKGSHTKRRKRTSK